MLLASLVVMMVVSKRKKKRKKEEAFHVILASRKEKIEVGSERGRNEKETKKMKTKTKG